MERAKDLPGITLKTSLKPAYGCAIGVFSLKDRKPTEVCDELFKKWKIHAVAIEREAKPGTEAPMDHTRITPHVYTTTQELDRLVDALRAMAT
jgi:selenocysteine lyase/cysteine desulfurase